ncbi:AAA family ATPase [Bacillus wiedmannii]|uniref:AAA family ATPase n=2 Tax=Bacillus wiedmannii TaxID=1890302 RepID=UPI00065B49D7|nr:AAA family ATPase [Bacillus wiedmannii]KMP70433.1 hypothetical protein TU62_31455 [Bacillus cereus]MCQ6570315.1 AAA family ATPase [Bacillus wiedmannii]WMS84132.1 AAA family ATPase [Bacillus wiedmannii]HDR7355640.1 AAA family ATPase [Bacillus wiedmannii]HDR7675612.1 AAA family ATPase [Bacillus wiedmannii]
MSKRIVLEKLTLIGFRKDYVIKFKKGLNYISGPMSTGKSSIVEMINYAFGSEKHKNYIEIKNSCSDVQLEFYIGDEKFKIIRPLFDFERPIKLFCWEKDKQDYKKEFKLLEIDSPKNEKSLSAFLLKQLSLTNIIVANQPFSFRDLFKYSYISQSQIDSENLLQEKTWGPNIKRKPTFEIIFNIYDELLGALKQNEKDKIKEINLLKTKESGVYEFLKELKFLDLEEPHEKKRILKNLLSSKKEELQKIKNEGKFDDSFTMELEKDIIGCKEKISKLEINTNEKTLYINKLILLRNQYTSEIDKIEFIIEGGIALRGYTFQVCPSCLNELVEKEGCSLCGSELDSLSDQEIKVFKSELRRLKIKFKNIVHFIEKQNIQLENLITEKENTELELNRMQRRIDDLRNQYISPFVEQIEYINFQIGDINSEIEQLEKNLIVYGHLANLRKKIFDEGINLEKIGDEIAKKEEALVTKEDIIKSLNTKFNAILEGFCFPKLSNAYIKESNYLPYVRGVKYDQIGSLGAVTMITIAYFLAIALQETNNKNHTGLLIIDSPRKNLGADAKNDDEFKDESIFNSIIKYFIQVGKDNEEEIQLIVINNGYPKFLNKKDLIIEFDGVGTGKLPYGLIDDIKG